jgi:hypothetical protein
VCCDKDAASQNMFLDNFMVILILESFIIKCFLHLKDPECTVVIASCSHEGQSLMTPEIHQQSTDHSESEDDAEVFILGRKDSMEVPLIPKTVTVGSL